jgi:mono/diheme cytochrome c family protein
MPNTANATSTGAHPALAHTKKLLSPVYPVYTMPKGRQAMPAFAGYSSDAQVAAAASSTTAF